ncbi:MAG: GxxExxY protein [Verrucomicrobia bacterium]|nr:GxxExxY protein [Verrucomicrobiota bacterium]
MPIEHSLQLKSISDAEFAVIDKVVMDCAYAAHNKFGRLFDERVYENDVAARLRALGLEVHTQVPLVVGHGSFRKTYYLDLIVNNMLYELKVVSSLTLDHDAQALNYAMLQDIRLVKLLNFGEAKVRGKVLSNAVRTPDRYQPTLRKSGMHLVTPHCERLISHFKDLLHDWGTHLSSHLYNEALIHHFGGEARCIQRMELNDRAVKLGTHRVQLYAENHAFIVTSLSRDQAAYVSHLDILLSHTDLELIQWINLNRSRVEITTLSLAGE